MKITFFIVVLALSAAITCYSADTDFVTQCLNGHNDERASLGIPALTWSKELAAASLSWAKNLASTNVLKNSSGRSGIGENVGRRVTKSNSVEVMITNWVAEKSNYVHKPYPDCSATGDKFDIIHYTQIIWAATTEFGCGFATGFGKDYLVCQYKTSGNKLGQIAYDKSQVTTPSKPSTKPVESTPEPKPTKTPAAETKTETQPTKTSTRPKTESQSTKSSGDPFIDQVLKTHNDIRTPLGAPKLTWSEDLAVSALKWAKELARMKKMKHSSGRDHVGENVAYTPSKSDSLAVLLDMWVDEKKYYIHKPYPDCSKSGDSGDVGHYTQMIWADTTEVGCGLATSSADKDYLVCQYKTSGNRKGKYAYDKSKVGSSKSEIEDEPETQPTKTSTTPKTETKTESEPTKTSTSGNSFITQCLKMHNDQRTPLGIPKVTWSSSLASSAQKWAKELARMKKMKHSSGRDHIGENVSYTATKPDSLSRLIQMWIDERKYYTHKAYPNCSKTGDTGDVGHYTQMIWKDTTEIGCGIATSSANKDYLVCQYKTSGNRRGKFAY